MVDNLIRSRADPRIIPSNASVRSRRVLGSVFGAVLLTVVIAAMLGSRAMLLWVQALPDGSAESGLEPIATGWNDAMQHIGMAKIDGVLHNGMQTFQAWKFPGSNQNNQ